MAISDERRIFLMKNAPRLFARLFEQLMLASLLTQSQLSKMAIAFRKERLYETGLVEHGDSQIGAMSQTGISNVISGVVPKPTDGQLWIWLEILQDWYNSEEMKQRIEDNDLDMLEFPEQLKRDLELLALRGSIEEIDAAYERCKDLDLLVDRPIVLPGKAYQLPTVQQKYKHHETSHDLRSLRTTEEIPPVSHEPNSDSLPNSTFLVRRALEEPQH